MKSPVSVPSGLRWPIKHSQADFANWDELAEALIQNAGTGIYIVRDGKFLYVNKLFQQLTGYEEEELLNTDSLSFVHPEDRETVRRQAKENLKGEQPPFPYEYRFVKNNGEIIWVLERVTSIKYDGLRTTMGSFMDITERKRGEEELKKSLKLLRQAMEGAVHAMAVIIESRDPYTAGHQRRVTNLACAIAKKMGLPQTQIDGIRLAASVHDIGKICVPAEILNKPGELGEIEHSMIEAHSQVGYNALKEIAFPFPVAQIVLQHHERVDGSGYPMGLTGESILLEAKILGVADVVEAMSSHRPYRPALGIDQALAEISANSGRLYDTRVVNACLKIFEENQFKFE